MYGQPSSTANQPAAATGEVPEVAVDKNAPADVIIDGRSILTVYQPIGEYTPTQRAEKIAERIIAALRT
jgi:hypothetical protein